MSIVVITTSGSSCGGLYGRRRLPYLRRGRLSSSSSSSAAAFPRACSQSQAHHDLHAPANADPVEVIGIGSRKDAVVDFCSSCSSGSLSSSPSRLRFWTMHSRDSSKVHLIQRCPGTDTIIRDMEFPFSTDPCPSALILVASTGNVLEHTAATELLDYVKSKGIIAISIFLWPFRFEGRRRHEEADNFSRKLQTSSNFQIVIEGDSLLKAEAETLSEAFESANNAVFLSISMISALISASQLLENAANQLMEEISPSEAIKRLEDRGEARVSFGADYSTNSAIKQAIFNNSHIPSKKKDSDGVVFLTVTSASVFDKNDLLPIIHTFRRFTNFDGEVICSKIYEPSTEPRLIIVSLLTVGFEDSIEPKKGFLSGLAQRVPFLSYFTRKPDTPELGNELSRNDISNLEEKQTFKIESEAMDLITVSETNKQATEASESDSSFWNFGPGFHVAKLWAQERNTSTVPENVDGSDTFTIPVGVKSSGNQESMHSKISCENGELTFSNPENAHARESLSDSGLGAVLEICNSAVELIKSRSMVEPRKQGVLSNRAASMLEAERETEKTWSPVVQMEYKGGIYKGRCQCGIPEGKGRLTFSDGSIYDGMWRNGKRSGLGTFYYSNGDVFHGTWRDDLMHGKGWYYFGGGDRWFANFWKGRASGEGRFYSRDGSIYSGHFRNGWRHGESLYIDANGSRWSELWDDGVLIRRNTLNK